jgi:hypothetical protein
VLINRNEASRATSDGEQISVHLKEGMQSMCFLKEPFTRNQAYSFQMGAFKSAVETGPYTSLSLRERVLYFGMDPVPRHGSVEAHFWPPIGHRERLVGNNRLREGFGRNPQALRERSLENTLADLHEKRRWKKLLRERVSIQDLLE